MTADYSDDCRGISPVIGVVLMVVLTVLLAGMFAVGATGLTDRLGTQSFDDAIENGELSVDNGEELLVALPDETGESTHRVSFELEETVTFDEIDIEVEYDDESAFRTDDVTGYDLTVGIDTTGDGEPDEELVSTANIDDFETEDDEIEVEHELGDEQSLSAGKQVVIEYDSVENLEAGTFEEIEVEIEFDDDFVDSETTLEISG